ncbi:hyaluronidase-1 isoform X5 [Castor canadensis]|uniref:Hyaluronidase-1 isoform X5 n=1 Tax=Castor canadensis TaxID=51338 RepID=A0AC58LE01_CASCN
MKPFSPKVSPDSPHTTTVHLLRICTLFLTLIDMVQGSMLTDRPFITVWNANTKWCLERHGVDVDVSVFDVVTNQGQTFRGPNMTIFYSWQLGTYPYYTTSGEPIFGGLPQNASLDTHLAHTFQDIQDAMPAPDFSGLAVIDWEAWRPRWAFNWDTKDIYRQRSRALVRAQHPDWPEIWVEAVAQNQFQEAAQAWMAELVGTGKAQMFVEHRVGEAFRVAAAARDPNLPVLPYVQIFYDMTNHLLPLDELEHSLGESAAQGAAGVVLWVSWENTKTKESCQAIKDYMDTTLGPFILNVTSGALLCSQALCSGHGRCARRPGHPKALLFLSPARFSIQLTPGGKPLTLKGAVSLEDLAQMAVKFKCRCYHGWRGTWCEQQGM